MCAVHIINTLIKSFFDLQQLTAYFFGQIYVSYENTLKNMNDVLIKFLGCNVH